jgi:hypothetical protein
MASKVCQFAVVCAGLIASIHKQGEPAKNYGKTWINVYIPEKIALRRYSHAPVNFPLGVI